MKNRSLSASLIVATVGFATISVLVTVYSPAPGELSAVHGDIIDSSSLSSCDLCHSADTNLPIVEGSGCLNCHGNIARQIEENKGYHAYLHRYDGRTCFECHPEHIDRRFPLIHDRSYPQGRKALFDHPHLEGRFLTGAHDDVACEGCHQEPFRDPVENARGRAGTKTTTSLGLDQTCRRCHEDPHSGTLSESCESCHGQTTFEGAGPFRHDDVFPLRVTTKEPLARAVIPRPRGTPSNPPASSVRSVMKTHTVTRT